MKATKVTRTRRYRITKRNPQRSRATIKMDLGNVEQQISLIMPPNAKIVNVEVPKEKNPDLMTVYFSNIKVCYYMKDKKGFVYDSDGVYCGSFDYNDLKRLFVKIGASLKAIKHGKA